MARNAIEVRRAGPQDVEALVGLYAQARAERLGGAGPLPPPAVGAVQDRLLRAISAVEHHLVLLALIEGAPAGYAVLRSACLPPVTEQPVLALEQLHIDPAHRRRGVGRAILRHVVALADAWGCDRVVADSAAGAREVHRFLARLGFAPVITRRSVPTTVLRRHLHEPGRSGTFDEVARRRSLRARLARQPAGWPDAGPSPL